MNMEFFNAIKEPLIKIFRAISELEREEDKYTIMMSLAADFLHDVPDELRTEFFEKYESLREEVVAICG